MKKQKEFKAEYSREEWKELIYDLMNGSRDLQNYPVGERVFAADEFAKNTFCEQKYAHVYEAKQHLRARLSESEYEDVETIIINLEQIGRYLAMRMFDHGEAYASEKTDTEQGI